MKDTDNQNPTNQVKRINFSYISHELQHLLHLESGFLYTVKELFFRPGKLVRSFILADRTKATKPLIFLIFSATLFTLLFHFFHTEYHFFSLNQEIGNVDQYLKKEMISNWVNSHIGYTSLFIGFLISLWISLFFKKHGYNIYEITVLLCYSIGQSFLIVCLFALTGQLFKSNVIANIGVFAAYLYVFWSIGQFFGEKKIINYIKSFSCCLLGAVSFRLILILLANIFYYLGLK